MVLLDVLEKPPFSEAGKGLFGKVRFFGGTWDRNRGMDGITIKLIVKLCSSCAVCSVWLQAERMKYMELKLMKTFVCKKWCYREVRGRGAEGPGLMFLLNRLSKPIWCGANTWLFPLWANTATVAGAGWACPDLLKKDQIALEAAVEVSTATGDRMSPLIFVITKCNSDIHRQGGMATVDLWQLPLWHAMMQLCPQK